MIEGGLLEGGARRVGAEQEVFPAGSDSRPGLSPSCSSRSVKALRPRRAYRSRLASFSLFS